MPLGYEKAIQEMMSLNSDGVHLVLMELMEKGKINFVELSKMYVAFLQKERTEKDRLATTFALHLSMYCAKDPSPGGKHARKILYETGFYTGKDGSAFGQQLENEFNSGNQNTNQ